MLTGFSARPSGLASGDGRCGGNRAVVGEAGLLARHFPDAEVWCASKRHGDLSLDFRRDPGK
jgi:hypothetical protein